jgi:hypothetical protein
VSNKADARPGVYPSRSSGETSSRFQSIELSVSTVFVLIRAARAKGANCLLRYPIRTPRSGRQSSMISINSMASGAAEALRTRTEHLAPALRTELGAADAIARSLR